MSPRRLIAVIAAIAGVLVTPAAAAAAATSSNWAGYAAHSATTTFRSVSARWRVPAAACTAGTPTYSAMWIGLGGYSGTSSALEQTGTESDCTTSGRAVYSAWYEMVPAASQDLRMRVTAGNLMSASVSASGGRVTLVLRNLTTGRSFTRTFKPSTIDATSADWIVEAPSTCDSAGNCEVLPLTDFGRATFTSARATTAQGRTGGIAARWWSTAAITLRTGPVRFASYGQGTAATASPSALRAASSAFSVTYASAGNQGPGGRFFGVRRSAAGIARTNVLHGRA